MKLLHFFNAYRMSCEAIETTLTGVKEPPRVVYPSKSAFCKVICRWEEVLNDVEVQISNLSDAVSLEDALVQMRSTDKYILIVSDSEDPFVTRDVDVPIIRLKYCDDFSLLGSVLASRDVRVAEFLKKDGSTTIRLKIEQVAIIIPDQYKGGALFLFD